MNARDVSNYIIHYFQYKGDSITNKKLQKLLYYIEAWNLVYINSFIEEDFEAWVHGPVIPSVYNEYKKFGYSNIELSSVHIKKNFELLKQNIFDTSKREDLFEAVLNKYGSLASFQLELLTHSEPPWINARGDIDPTVPCSNVIDKSEMKKYYSSLLKNVKKK